MSPKLLAVVLFAAAAIEVVRAQNCSNTSVGFVPLSDLGAGTYQGFAGGLYGNGQNTPPPAHLASGQQRMLTVLPRDATGAPATNGRIVLLSLGMSNTTQEFSTWLATANADPNKSAAVTIVDGAQGGQDAVTISNPLANFWTVVDQRLATAGVTAQQVQVVWLKEAIAGVSGGFPAAAQQLQGLLGQIVRIVKQRYPHAALCFLSSRTYAGYATGPLNPEPYAYESGFAVQWTLQQQIAGDPLLNCDPAAGPVMAPWLGFGPYLWTDGTTPRSDGLVWNCVDVQPDGTHPSPSGRAKVANLLQQFFPQHVLTAPWYVVQGTAASFGLFGFGCPGVAGVPTFRNQGLPQLGNANFRVGVENAAPNALALLWWSSTTALLPIAGTCSLQVDPSLGLPVWIAVTSPTGVRIEPLPIPNQTGLVGFDLYGQWLIDDAQGAPLPGFAGLAMSRPARIHMGL